MRLAEHVEPLEERCLLAVTTSFDSGTGVLMITSDAADGIRLAASSSTSTVQLNGNSLVLNSQPVLAGSVTRLEVSGGPGNNVIDLSGVRGSSFPGLVGAPFKIIVNAGAGNDTVIGGDLGESLNGGDGNDSLRGAGGADSLEGQTGRDTLKGEAGNDTLRGGDGNDALDGGDANDQVFGERDSDIARGSSGNDTVDGGDAADRVFGDSGNDSLRGGEGNDLIEGNSGNDTLLGELGNDTLLGGDGHDGLAGGSGNDSMDAATGNDTLVGSTGDDCLKGGSGSDLLLGRADNDRLDGQSGHDTVAGGLGDDVILDPLSEINEAVQFTASWLPAEETDPPVITTQLANDTGRSPTDGLTIDPSLQGTLTDASAITLFRAGFDGLPLANYVSVLADRQPDGRLVLSAARLAQINGGPLSDGAHTLHLVAEDEYRNRATHDIFFTLDTTAPTISQFDLSLTSDTGNVGDQTTTAARVALAGNITDANPLVQVQLPALGLVTVANASGGFQFPDVMLSVGQNTFDLSVIDLAGNTSSFSRTLVRDNVAAGADVVLTWNRAALEAIRLDATAPPVATRNLAIASLAMYDTVNAIEHLPAFAVRFDAAPGTSAEAAVAAAAHRALSYLYPAQQAIFDAQLTQSLSTIPNGVSEDSGTVLGRNIADAILALRDNDGYRDFVDYVPGSAPGQWQPTAPMFDVALLPQWADLRPFAMTAPDQFRPGGPPALTSAEYATAWDEVRRFGEGVGSERTADQTSIARYWADGPGTYTPPGHWNVIAADVAQQQGNSLAANARLFAQLNVALADAAIVAWDAKYTYEFWRPITAIQNADLDGNAATTADETWQPFLITPPFPEYVSGHSTFSGAAAQVLTSIFGNNVTFTSDSPGFLFNGQPVQRTYSSFQAAANEAGQSRIYGGIHFQFANQDGLAAGRNLADYVLDRFTVSTDDIAPTVAISSPEPDDVFANNPTLVGQVFDNLSGVASLEVLVVPLSGGLPTPNPQLLTPDQQGRFTFTPTLATDGTADGAYTLTFTARDIAGNQSTTDFNFTLDTRNPTITLDGLTDGAELSIDQILSGIADGTGSTITELSYRFDTGAKHPLIFDRTTGQFSEPVDLSRLTVGMHTLSIDARDAAGNLTTLTLNVTLPELIPFGIEAVTPLDGTDEVGVTFRPQVFFTRPVDPTSLNANNFFATDSTGTKLPATIVPANDGSFAWLFFNLPMPGASTVTVHLDGSTILALQGGDLLDADNDVTPGGLFQYQFTTVSLVPLVGTTLSGKVVDPGPDLKPTTLDDILAGADGALHTPDDVFLTPIAGVKVFIVGLEDQAVFSDANGDFHFDAVPAGNVKLAIDGNTATNPPAGFYFPEMVMDLNLEVGQANTVMGTMGKREQREANLDRPEVYLPRLQSSILQGVSDTQPTMVGVDAVSAPNLTDQQRQFLQLEVQPGSLIGADGQPLTGAAAQLGISTVPPELVRDMLPAGLLQHTFDITIQAPDAAVFSAPLQITFPNLFNAAPGTQLNFLSFDHTTGRLVIEGTATVSADGMSVVSNPGTGITKPGWHGISPPSKCVEQASQGLVQNLATAAGVAGDMFNVVKDVTGAVEDLNDALNTSIPTLPSTFGTILNGIGVIQDVKTLLTLPPGSSVWQQPETYSLLLQAGLALSPGGAIATVGRLVAAAYGLNGAYDSLQDAAKGIEKLRSQTSCPEPQTSETPTAFSESIASQIGEAGQTAGAQAPLLESLANTMSEMGSILAQGVTGEPLFGLSDPQVQRFQELFTEYESTIAQIDSLGTFWMPADDTVDDIGGWIETNFGGGGSGGGGSGPVVVPLEPPCPIYWSAEFLGTELRGRGRVDFVGPPSTTIRLRGYDPTANLIAEMTFDTGAGNATVRLPNFVWQPVAGMPDQDNDGLVDASEEIIGTLLGASDSDGDGVSDLAEVQQCLDPLSGRAVATGIVASLPLQGEAKEVVLVGSTLNAEQQTAYVATGSYGLAIVDASQFLQPVVLGQFDLPGDAVDVAVDSRLGVAVVAAGVGGLHFVDVSDPTRPVLRQTLNVTTGLVEVFEGIAYTAVDDAVLAYDVLTGEDMQRLSLGGGNIVSIARDGTTLFTIDSGNQLRAVDFATGNMVARGALTVPEAGGKLFVGGGVAYVGRPGNRDGGFSTANVSNLDDLSLISGVDATNIAATTLAVNGSGLAVGVGHLIGQGRTDLLDVLDVSDPENTNGFITRFELSPGEVPFSVTIAAGIAFVAGGRAGLQVVNYRAFDNQGQAPTINITSAVADVDPNVLGIQVQEGTTIFVTPTVTDDVQVRNVELLVNGQVVRNDVSFPFDLSTFAPNITPESDSISLQVKATDTGGNVGLSPTVTLQLVPDTFAPSIVSSNITEGASRGLRFRAINLTFSEPMSRTEVTADDFELTGPDGAVTPINFQFRSNDRSIQITYPQLSIGNYQFLTHAGRVSDRAENALAADDEVINFAIRAATIAWVNLSGGFWDDPANWDTGVVPTITDDVLIDVPGTATITLRTGTSQVRSLLVREALTLTGGTLAVDQNFQLEGTLTFNGGTLSDTTLEVETGGRVIAASNSSNRLLNVTVNGDVELLATTARLRIEGGTTFTTAHLNGNNSVLEFAPGSVLTGTILFEGSNTGTRAVSMIDTSGTLTIGPTGVIRTTADFAGSAFLFNSGNTLVNQGTISSQTSGRTIWVNPASFSNEGTLEVINGGTLTLIGMWSSAAGSTITATNSTLNLGASSSTWSNAGALVASNSTTNLGGTFTTAGLNLPAFTRSGGTVNLTGTLNNADDTLTLDATTGTWNLLGGTISGGTLDLVDSPLLSITSSGGILTGVTMNGDLDLSASSARVTIEGNTTFVTAHLKGNGSFLGFAPDSVLSGTILFEGPNTGTRAVNGTSGTLTIGPTGLIRTTADFTGSAFVGSNANATLVNQGTISSQTSGRAITVNADVSFTNQGTLEAKNGGNLSVFGLTGNLNTVTLADASTVTLNGTNYVNNLSLAVAAGQTLTLYGTWSSMGATSIAGGTLNLGGTFTTAGLNLPQFQRTDGTVNLTGTLNNAGDTLTLNTTTGSWVLQEGQISGGTIEFADGEALLIGTANGRLTDVAVNGDLLLTQTSARLQVEGTTTFANARLRGQGSLITFSPGYVLTGNVLFEGSGSNSRGVFSNGTLTIGPTGSIRTAADFTDQFGANISGMTIVNQGLISSEAGFLQVIPSSFTNEGTVQAINGGSLVARPINAPQTLSNQGTMLVGTGSTLTVGGNVSNTGTFNVDGGTLNLGGTFTTAGLNLPQFQRTGGTVNFTGTLNNAGDTLTLNTTTGSWVLQEGQISGGTIEFADGEALLIGTANGRLTDVAVNGDLLLTQTSAWVQVEGTTTFANARLRGQGSLITFSPGYVLTGNVLFEGSGSNSRSVFSNGTLTIGPTGSIRTAADFTDQFGANISGMTIVNQGLISSEAGFLQVIPSSFTNEGTVQAINGGSLSVSNLASHAGTIHAGSGSTVTINGAFTQTTAGNMSMDVAGSSPSQIGQVAVSDAATLDGILHIEFVNGFDPAINDSFPVLTYGSRSGTFSSVSSTGLGAGKAIQPSYNAGDVTIVVGAALQAASAPSSTNDTGELFTADALQAFYLASLPRLRVGLVSDVEFVVTDLPNNLLGLAAGHVMWTDRDAAGFGWFVDSTPDADEEFGLGGAASGRMDLLTVLAHELGHLLGFEHDTEPGHLMSEMLAPGIRLLPIGLAVDIDDVFANPDWL